MKKIFTTFTILIFTVLAGIYINSLTLENTAYAQSKKAAAAKKKPIKLNLNDAEMNEFLKMMSEIVGKNIITNDQVRGKITIISSKGIPPEEAYNLMKSILEIKGFAVVEMDNVIKIIPVSEAIQKNVEVIVDGKAINPYSEDAITYIYEVKYSNIDELNNVLNNLKSVKTRIVVYRELNVLILSGIASEINGLISITNALDKKVEVVDDSGEIKEVKTTGNIHVVHLQHARAEDLANVLSRVPFSQTAKIQTGQITPPQVNPSGKAQSNVGAQPAQQPQIPLSIIANKDTNSIIVTASAEEFDEIKKIINQLDIIREQVLLEALIIEISAENGWGFGIDWMLGNQSGDHIYGGSQLFGSIPDYTDPTDSGKTIPIPLNTGFQLGYLSDKSTLGFMIMNASANDNNFNILSTPQILATDNQEAELNVGESIPVPSNNRVGSDGAQTYSFDYKDVGLKMKITPHISKNSKIAMKFYLEQNSVLGQTETIGNTFIPPKLGKRDLKSDITVENGQTIVVGGLIRNNKTDMESKVPVLGDIPLLGWLFKKKTIEYKKTNLLIFITPTVVTDRAKIDAITEQKMKEQQLLEKK